MANDIDFKNVTSDINTLMRKNPQASTSQVVGAGIDMAMQFMKTKKAGLKSAVTTLNNALEGVNYAQTENYVNADTLTPLEGVEEVNGQYDLYDYNYALARNALDTFKDKTDSVLFADERDEINLEINEAEVMLAYQETQRELRESSLDKLEGLAKKYIAATKNDISFTDPGSLESANLIMRDLENVYSSLNEKFAKMIPGKYSTLYGEAANLADLSKKSIEADLRVDAEGIVKGIQVDVSDPASPHLIDFLKKRGLEGGETTEGIQTFELDPELYKKDESGNYIMPDKTLYKDALQSFGQYEETLKAMKSADLKLESRVAALAPYDLVENWAADPTKQRMAMLVGQAVWSNEDITAKDENGKYKYRYY